MIFASLAFALSLLGTVGATLWPRPGDVVAIAAPPWAARDTAIHAALAAGGTIVARTASGISARFAEPDFLLRILGAGGWPIGRRPETACGGAAR